MKEIIKLYLFMVCLFCTQIGCSIQTTVETANYPPFIDAVAQGDILQAEKLLQNGDLPNQTSLGNQTALHIAAAEGNNEMVKWLLAHEANPFVQDLNGNTAADFARDEDNISTAKILDDYMLLMEESLNARLSGDIKQLSELLENDYREYTLLHIFAQAGTIDQIQAEIQAGANVNAKNVMGMTPLHKATSGEQIEIATLLLENGANVNEVDIWNNPAIYYAILLENLELVELYLNAGAKLDYRSAFGNETILEYAERIGNPEIIELLNGQ